MCRRAMQVGKRADNECPIILHPANFQSSLDFFSTSTASRHPPYIWFTAALRRRTASSATASEYIDCIFAPSVSPYID